MKHELISEHIFLFPFSWKYNCKKKNNLFLQHTQIQNKSFELLNGWQPHKLEILSEKDYNEFVYFYKPIRMALYTLEKNPIIVRNYKYAQLDKENYFIIAVNNKTYKLHIDSISLKLYKTGIGLLSFNLLNTQYEKIEDIEKFFGISMFICLSHYYDTGSWNSCVDWQGQSGTPIQGR